MKSLAKAVVVLIALSTMSIEKAVAAEHGGGFHGGGHGGFSRDGGFPRGHTDWHGRDYARFSIDEQWRWQRGEWNHDWHLGRYGWWWVVGDEWYLYPERIYPYPTYVAPAIGEVAAPPASAGLQPAGNWYYCDDPKGYYPYVASCKAQWHAIPTAPQEKSPEVSSLPLPPLN